MINLPESVMTRVFHHAEDEYPLESCGVVIVESGKMKYVACRNIHREATRNFIIDPEDYANAEDRGEIVTIVHSHPDKRPVPSPTDRFVCASMGLPWLIVGWPNELTEWMTPAECEQGLIGREFSYGILDCYTIIKDYYKTELDIALPDYRRVDYENDTDMYLANYTDAGFVEVDSIEKHDVLLLKLRTQGSDHGAIYVGGNRILHHLENRLSSRDVYGAMYRDSTTHILRHCELL